MARTPYKPLVETEGDMRGSEGLAKAIEAVLSAPAYAAFCFLLLLSYRCQDRCDLLTSLLLSIVFASVMPVLVVLACLRAGLVGDLCVSRREERSLPFMGAISSYMAGAYSLVLTKAPKEALGLMTCYAFITAIMLAINLSWKISIHAAGISGPTTCLVYALGPQMAWLYLLLLPVCWSRVRLGQHDVKQVLAGSLLPIPASWFWMHFSLTFIFGP